MKVRRVGALLGVMLVAWGLGRIRWDVDMLHLLPEQLPAVRGLQAYQKHFANTDELIIAVEAADAASAEAASAALVEVLRAATNQVATVFGQPPWEERPGEAAELMGVYWLNQPPAQFQQMTQRLAQADAVLAAARERLAVSFSPEEVGRTAYDPFGVLAMNETETGGVSTGWGRGADAFVSRDGTARLIFVRSRDSLVRYGEAAQWLGAVRARVEAWRSEEAWREVRLRFTGGPVFLVEIATGMERDMTGSVLGTIALVSLFFWLVYGEWRILIRLVLVLLGTIVITMALGGWIFGRLSVISLGFAAILLGLVADYGVILYAQRRSHPGLSTGEIRRQLGPSIVWSATTTALAFAALAWVGLPGLTQLGVLVALGLVVGALGMMYVFFGYPKTSSPSGDVLAAAPGAAGLRLGGWWPTWMVLGCVVVVLGVNRGGPGVTHVADALRPKKSEAYDAARWISERWGQPPDPLWWVVTGIDVTEARQRWEQARPLLAEAAAKGAVVLGPVLQDFWPDAARQVQNRAAALSWVAARAALQEAAMRQGFRGEALVGLNRVLDVWARSEREAVVWPTNEVSRWVMQRFAVTGEQGVVLAGAAHRGEARDADGGEEGQLVTLTDRLAGVGVWLTGWGVLGEALYRYVEPRWVGLLSAVSGVIVLCLWLAFRRVGEVMLCLLALALGFAFLASGMTCLGWSWNLMNLMAVPVLLGSGVDYGIHMQHALRQARGSVAHVRATTGRALFFCAGTTVVGFGSLGWASNAGLASLGQVCALGMTGIFLVAYLMLPVWWRALYGTGEPAVAGPSRWYGSWAWRWGLRVVARVPAPVLDRMGTWGGWIYWRVCSRRRGLVERNVAPLVGSDPERGRQVGRQLIVSFGRKLVDLLRFEAGMPVEEQFLEPQGWEHFAAARARGTGVLLVTVHLGNWELGGPMLTRKGVRLVVLSQAEPEPRLTELRRQARAAWGIETIIVGQDPFAFVEVIRRLQAGAVVVLLLDRPNDASAVTVELFGRRFRASVAAAELARAAGCAVMPTVVYREGAHYAAAILPECLYDRAALGQREARRQFTGEILRAFEPWLRQHPDQWYHFVPIWPEDGGGTDGLPTK